MLGAIIGDIGGSMFLSLSNLGRLLDSGYLMKRRSPAILDAMEDIDCWVVTRTLDECKVHKVTVVSIVKARNCSSRV